MSQCACPACQARLQMPDTMAGKQVRCPKCKAPFIVAASAAAAAKPAPPKTAPAKAPPRPTKPAEKSEAVTARVRPSASFAPAKKSAPSSRSRKHDDDDDDYDDVEPVRSKSKKHAKEKQSEFPWLLVSILGGGAVLLLFGVIGGIFLFGGSNKVAKKDLPAVIAAGKDPAKPDGRDRPGDKAAPEKPNVEEPVVNAQPPEFEAPRGSMPSAIAPELTQRVKRATAQIRVTFPNGETGEGSGFFAIERGLVVSNAHVVGMLHIMEKPRKIDVVINSGEPDEYHRNAIVLGADQDQDLALLRLDGEAESLPPPLMVDSQSPLMELQKVYVFGFPFGAQLGKNITVSESSISSFRKNRDGSLHQIQVNGGMHPGNSGGPVVDARGNVIGVSVAVIKGTLINFAIPGEKVRGMVQGRVLTTSFGEPYKDLDSIRMPLKVVCLDPMSRLKGLKVDVWTAPAGGARPFGLQKPPALVGDGPKKSVALNYSATKAEGDVLLPAIPVGHVLWVQPVLQQATGQFVWGHAFTVTTATDSPLQRMPANLTMNLASTPDRTIDLTSKFNIQLNSGGEKLDLFQKLDTEILENVKPRAAGDFEARLSVAKATLNNVGDEKIPQPKIGNKAIDLFKTFSYGFVVSPEGKLREVGIPTFAPSIDINTRLDADKLVSHLTNSYEATSFELPQRTIQPMEMWTSKIRMLFGNGRAKQPAEVTFHCTYEGMRGAGDAKVAFIRFDGEVRTVQRNRDVLDAKVHGYAHVDLARGYFSKVHVVVRSDVEQGNIFLIATYETTLTRTPGNPRGLAVAPPPSSVAPQANTVVAGKAILEKKDGLLQANDPPYKNTGRQQQVFQVKFVAGKSYIIEMLARDPKFDPFLVLEDPNGNFLMEDDDSGGNLDARLVYRATQTGLHRVIATCFNPIDAASPYQLRVLEVDDGKPGVNPKQPGVNPKIKPGDPKKMIPKKGPADPNAAEPNAAEPKKAADPKVVDPKKAAPGGAMHRDFHEQPGRRNLEVAAFDRALMPRRDEFIRIISLRGVARPEGLRTA